MSAADFVHILANAAPLYTGLTCGVVVGLGCLAGRGEYTRKTACRPRGALLVFFASVVVNWISLRVLLFTPGSISPLLWMMYLSILFNPILFFRIIFTVTALDPRERFSARHYLLPSVAFAVVMVWMGMAYHRSYSYGDPHGAIWSLQILGSFGVVSLIRWVFVLGYLIPSVVRIGRYCNALTDCCSGNGRLIHIWLYILIAIFVCHTAIPLVSLGVKSGYGHAGSHASWVYFISILIAVQNVILTYLVLSPVDEVSVSRDDYAALPAPERKYGQQFFRNKVEAYMAEEKPYLRPDLRITDLILPLQTNRTYLSSFINETYGVHFCMFVNYYRLVEYDMLCNDEKNRGLTKHELILRAGFSNYKAYQRARKSAGEKYLFNPLFGSRPESDE